MLASFGVVANELTDKEKSAAKRIYDTRCVKCHVKRWPVDYPPEEWQLWMKKMSRKAKLTPDEQKLMAHYFDSLRTEPVSKADPPANRGSAPGSSGNPKQSSPERKAGNGH